MRWAQTRTKRNTAASVAARARARRLRRRRRRRSAAAARPGRCYTDALGKKGSMCCGYRVRHTPYIPTPHGRVLLRAPAAACGRLRGLAPAAAARRQPKRLDRRPPAGAPPSQGPRAVRSTWGAAPRAPAPSPASPPALPADAPAGRAQQAEAPLAAAPAPPQGSGGAVREAGACPGHQHLALQDVGPALARDPGVQRVAHPLVAALLVGLAQRHLRARAAAARL
jgi:hypothetical protein